MADSKYGRLFTEADVLAIVDEALMAGLGRSAEVGTMHEILEVLIRRAEADKAPMRFPVDEPLFLLRGQDAYAPSGVGDYLARLTTPLAHRLEVQRSMDEMREWQAANRDRVKVPD